MSEQFILEAWEHVAACRGEDASLFFGPNRYEPKAERDAREAAAKAICLGCPSIEPCRRYAVGAGEVYGVWGGLGEVERRSLLTGLQAKAG